MMELPSSGFEINFEVGDKVESGKPLIKKLKID
jgi:hypothetical protein